MNTVTFHDNSVPHHLCQYCPEGEGMACASVATWRMCTRVFGVFVQSSVCDRHRVIVQAQDDSTARSIA